jgi:hypothetical protein
LTFVHRSIMVSFIILLSLVAVACGELKISASTGDARGCSGYTESLGAKINDQIQESTTLTGSCLSQSFKGSGVVCRSFCKFGWPCYPTSQSSSIVKYFLVVIHSSLISIRIDTPSLMNDLSLGNAPTTLVLLFSSLLILSNPLVVLILLW